MGSKLNKACCLEPKKNKKAKKNNPVGSHHICAGVFFLKKMIAKSLSQSQPAIRQAANRLGEYSRF